MNGIKKVPGLHDNLKDALTASLEQIRGLLTKTEQAYKAFSKLTPEDTVTFEVNLHSLWANEGEIDVTEKSTVGLNEVIRQAQDRFKLINNRSDVQARYTVKLHFGTNGEFTLAVPEQFIVNFAKAGTPPSTQSRTPHG